MLLYTETKNIVSQAIREKNIEKLSKACNKIDPNDGLDFYYPLMTQGIQCTPFINHI